MMFITSDSINGFIWSSTLLQLKPEICSKKETLTDLDRHLIEMIVPCAEEKQIVAVICDNSIQRYDLNQNR